MHMQQRNTIKTLNVSQHIKPFLFKMPVTFGDFRCELHASQSNCSRFKWYEIIHFVPSSTRSPVLACRGRPRRFGARNLSGSFFPLASPHPSDTHTPRSHPAFSSSDSQSYQTTFSLADMNKEREDIYIATVRHTNSIYCSPWLLCSSGTSCALPWPWWWQ